MIMKTIAIFGSTGMLGRMIYDHLRWIEAPYNLKIIPVPHLEGQNINNYLTSICPEIIINCAGIVKQAIKYHTKLEVIYANVVLPCAICAYCIEHSQCFSFHFSSDCVLANNEPDIDPKTGEQTSSGIYRFSKACGEFLGLRQTVFRTSFIGREFHSNYGLMNWLLNHSQDSSVVGYRKALFSGTTNLEIAKIMSHLISSGRYVDLEGLYNITGEPISKYDLLGKLNAAYHLRLNIVPDDSVIVDRTLDPSRFVEATGIEPKGWDQLIKEYQDYYSFVAS